MGELTLFYILAGLIIGSSVAVVTVKNPVTSAMFLIATLFSVACLYAMMSAHFIAAIQVLVYAGAIMVLFLFVIMLLNLRPDELRTAKPPLSELAMLGLTVVGFLFIAWKLSTGAEFGVGGGLSELPTVVEASNTEAVGMALFTQYLWPFELASFLILLAIVASVVIAKKEKATAAAKKS